MADHQTTSSQLDGTVVFAHVPFNRLLDLNREHAQDGSARVSLQMRPELTNYHNNTHGGVIMSMLDSAMASAAFSKSGFRQSVVTLQMSTTFLKAGRGKLIAHGIVLGGGRSVCFCEAHIEDESGDVIAKAVGTFKYLNP